VFRNLLVGIDDSASAAHALTQAIEMARESGGRLGLRSAGRGGCGTSRPSRLRSSEGRCSTADLVGTGHQSVLLH
jgi:nucleotide-binding universal stress UspA family protein